MYEGAAGVRQVGGDNAMTVDTVLGIFSMTKAVTGAAAMQQVERDALDLDAPAGVGVWATQLFPFQDPTATAELEAFESAVYASLV